MAWAPSYVATEKLAAFVRIGDSADDPQLEIAIATSSRAIDRATNRQFGGLDTPAPRYYTARWDPRRGAWLVQIDDLMSTAGLAVAFDRAGDQTYAAAITDYALRPVNAAADDRPWTELWVRPASAVQPTSLEDGVRIIAPWGWTETPAPIEEACLLQASRLLARRDSPFGVAGSPEAGSELRLLERLDPDVAIAVRPYRRMWGAV